MSDIIAIKLTSGEEVLAEFVSQSDAHLTVSKPRTIHLSQSGRSGLLPYLMADPDRKVVVLSIAAIVTWYEVGEDLSKAYLQATSGLILG